MKLIVTILGFGNIGKTITTLLLAKSDVLFTINVVDVNPKVIGAIEDFKHGMRLQGLHKLEFNNQDLFNHSDFIFHCAGASVPKGKSRLVTRSASIRITESIFNSFNPVKEPFIIVVANPVEIITYITQRITGLPKNKIVGTGTSLDSSRMNQIVLDNHPDLKEVKMVLLGEHGEKVFLSNYYSRINGNSPSKSIDDEVLSEYLNQTKNFAERIKATQRRTVYGVSFCAVQIFDALIQKQPVDLPVSTWIPIGLMEKIKYPNVVLSLFSKICQHGVTPDATYTPDESEIIKLNESAALAYKSIPVKFR